MIDITICDGLPYPFDNMVTEAADAETQPTEGAEDKAKAPNVDTDKVAEASDAMVPDELNPTAKDLNLPEQNNEASDASPKDLSTDPNPQTWNFKTMTVVTVGWSCKSHPIFGTEFSTCINCQFLMHVIYFMPCLYLFPT